MNNPKVTIGTISARVRPLSPDISCGEVYQHLEREPDLLLLPVVEDGRPVGLVSRPELLLKLADRFGRALFSKKPITSLMDVHPLLVDEATELSAMHALVLDARPSALTHGFIVTTGDKLYHGVGSGLDLLRLTATAMAQRAEDLEQSRTAEFKASRAKTRFLANMSHELRTPLNAIIGFSEMMTAGYLGPLGHPKYHEYVDDITSSARHLLQVINGILDLSRIEAGKIELSEAPFSVSAAVHDALTAVKPGALRNAIAIETSGLERAPVIVGDERKIIQVLINLLSNAVKFTPLGGTVWLSVGTDKTGLTIRIVDTGIGIATDQIETVLQPFGQADSDLNRKYEGTGLGLPIAKSFVEMHGGTLALTSEPHIGTNVAVHLPAARIVPNRQNDALLAAS